MIRPTADAAVRGSGGHRATPGFSDGSLFPPVPSAAERSVQLHGGKTLVDLARVEIELGGEELALRVERRAVGVTARIAVALTTSEALASGLVFAIVNPIPGQESRNSDFLLENGAAIKVKNVEPVSKEAASESQPEISASTKVELNSHFIR